MYLLLFSLLISCYLYAEQGAAAGLIAATTWHSALKINFPGRKKRKINGIDSKMANTYCLVVDEISMLGQTTLGLGARNARLLRGAAVNDATPDPFGGMSVVYCGDFLQLDPPSNSTVFCKADGGDDLARHGQHVWNQLNACVTLEESNRTSDPDLEAVLLALRTGKLSPHVEALIMSRTFEHREQLDVGYDATCLFYTNKVVNSVNQVSPHLDARRLGVPVVRLPIVISAPDGADVGALADDIRSYTSDTDSSAYIACGTPKDGLLRYSDLYCGMNVTVKAGNGRVEATALGNNGAAVVVGFADKSCRFINVESPEWSQSVNLSGGHTANVQIPPSCSDVAYILLRVDGPIAFRYKGLPPNVVALPRQLVKSRKLGVTFAQFPLRARKALTVHSAQGQTLRKGVVVDCLWGNRLAYVAVSRATSLADVVFLMPFDRKKITTQCVIEPSLAKELASLAKIHKRTIRAVTRLAPSVAAPPVPLLSTAHSDVINNLIPK
jgi:hypothetical protein